MTRELTDHQKLVIEAFNPRDNDIDVATVYHRVYGDAGLKSARAMLMKLGPVFKSINKKIKPAGIYPGETRRTYRYFTNIEG